MEIKLIALDLDGTTLNSVGLLTQITREAIENVIERNLYVVIATGRSFSALPDEIFETEIIAASIRNPIHVTDCALAGAHIATVPYNVIVQMTKHPLTDAGIEKFQKDYRAVFGD